MHATNNRLQVLSISVDPSWIDGNNHVSDRNYSKVFSDSEVAFLEHIGANKSYRELHGGHVYTVENHLTFLTEILLGDQMSVSAGLVDYSDQAMHLSFEMRNSVGRLCAHHETIVLHIVKDASQVPRVSPFLPHIRENIEAFVVKYGLIKDNPFCRKPMGIRK